MHFSSIHGVIECFARDRNLAIDIEKATDEEIDELDGILAEMTNARPFDNSSYGAYMRKYRDTYPLMVCDGGNSVSSYTSKTRACRKYIIPISEVLALSRGQSYAESDFDSVF